MDIGVRTDPRIQTWFKAPYGIQFVQWPIHQVRCTINGCLYWQQLIFEQSLIS